MGLSILRHFASSIRGFFRTRWCALSPRIRRLCDETRLYFRGWFATRPNAHVATPLYESNPFWALLTALFTLIAAAKHDVRWLLIIPWASAVVLVWVATARLAHKRARIVLVNVLAIGVALGLYRLDLSLGPSQRKAASRSPLALHSAAASVAKKPSPLPMRRQTFRPAHPTAKAVRPSFVYVVPGVWSPAPTPSWIMLVKHGGPYPVFNIELLFVDKDRQASLRKKGSLTPNDAESMDKTLHFSEIDRVEGVWAKMFFWSPLNPGNEHYEVVVASREGAFYENLGVKRTETGKWQYEMKVVNRSSRAVLIDCQDPEFSGPPLTRLPACFPRYVVGEKRARNTASH
jgi:hypothetical protein